MAEIQQETITSNNTEESKVPDSEIESIPEKTEEVLELLKDVSKFTVKKILKNNTTQKLICIEGALTDREGIALIILEKKVFPNEEEILGEGFFNEQTTATELYRNDIYTKYDFFPEVKHNALKATLIYPATEKHVEQFSSTESYMIEETPELYENVSLPKILKDSEQFSLQWADRVIFNDPDEETGFVMTKDLKWNDELSTLYMLAITRKRIRSIRDLNASHLPLLRHIKEAGTKAIFDKYGVSKSQLRIYFHYQPSFYHLHVHFTTFAVENSGTLTERAHLLTTVIRNIELMPDYYQKAVLTFRAFKLSIYEPYKQYEEEKQLKNE
ncbi:hypothetical protein HCN44_009529 [Aphidius gifuensis]|uniref:m7GpppX diphosphatase n=1 Tax=Aphidius gifuensis TaxID=684658 RepID=A0A834Y7U5_APHGI|nr:hypothetical protein HCN44_009529 [Aphidius gifuensis]